MAENWWGKLLEEGRIQTETRERKLDGTPMTTKGYYICIYNEKNQVTGHFGIQRNITAEKRAAKMLKQSESNFKHFSILLKTCFL